VPPRKKPPFPGALSHGRYRDRTSDLLLVRLLQPVCGLRPAGVIGSLLAGVLFAVDAELRWWECLLPFVLSYALYRASVGAAERLGTERRASIDLHRLELYERLGVSTANISNAERKNYATAVNRFLLWGEAIPETYLVKTSTPD
jgi:hypothetical protein